MSYYFPTPDECSHHSIFGKVETRTLAGDHLQFSLAEIPAGETIPSHTHPNEQLGIILSGMLKFTIAEETKMLRPGDVFRIPGGVPHSVVAQEELVRVLDVFYPIRDDYR
jgi:quercetin dioxygenase-like cupin family protein